MKTRLILYSLMVFLANTLNAQTNSGRGAFQIVVTQLLFNGASDPGGGGEATYIPAYNDGMGNTGSYSCLGFTNLAPGASWRTLTTPFAWASINYDGTLPNTIALSFSAHEDDSAVQNCTFDTGDDENCSSAIVNASTLAAFATPNTLFPTASPYNEITCVIGGVTVWGMRFQLRWVPYDELGGETCADARPICSGSGLRFYLPSGQTAPPVKDYTYTSGGINACTSPNSTPTLGGYYNAGYAPNNGNYTQPVSGNYYGCLDQTISGGSVLNPVWWYFKTATAGTHTMSLSGLSADIDFIIYGPFKSLTEIINTCGRMRNHTDCAFSTATSETINITDAQVGDYYALLVSNYATVGQVATLTQSAGTLDCDVLTECSVKNIEYISQTACNPATDFYTATVKIYFENPPSPSTLNVNGQLFTPTSTDLANGYMNVTLVNLPSNSLVVNVSAYFTNNPSCTGFLGSAFTAPASCDPCPAKAGNW